MLERALAEWPLKALSLGIAFALWVATTGEDQAVRDLVIPLEVRLQSDHILASSPPTTVTVRLEGARTVVRKLEPVELRVQLDLRDAPTGERDVQLSEVHLAGLPRGVDVDFFDPDRVRLSIDRRMRRELKVVAGLLGEPSAGYALYRALVRPEKLSVEGPEAAVRSLTELRTDPLRLDHRTRSFTEIVGAVPERPEVRIVDPRPIEVRVIIDTPPVVTAFEGVPVVLSNPAAKGSLSPTVVQVVLSGPAEALERLRRQQIRAVADVSEVESGAGPQQVGVEASIVDLPEEQLWRINVKSVWPDKVTLQLASGRPSP